MTMGQQGSSGGLDLGGDAALAGSCVLRRSSAVGTDRGRLRRLCRGGLSVLLRGQAGGAFGAAGALFPHAPWATSLQGIDSERLEWRCRIPCRYGSFYGWKAGIVCRNHSWLSRTRARLPHEVHTAIFDWVLALIAEAGLVKGERIGVDPRPWRPTPLRNIVRRDTGEGYRGMLARLAESGIETPTAEDLARLDRKRKGKKLSNQDWVSKSDPEAKIAKMKDGTTHLYKARARGGSGHRRGGWPPSYTRPTRATRRRWRRRWRRPRRISRRWTRHRRPKTRPNV